MPVAAYLVDTDEGEYRPKAEGILAQALRGCQNVSLPVEASVNMRLEPGI